MGVRGCSDLIESAATPVLPTELLRKASEADRPPDDVSDGRAVVLVDARGMALYINNLLAETAQSCVSDLLLRPALPEVSSAVAGLVLGLRANGIEPIFVDGAAGRSETDAFKQLTWYRRSVRRACKDAAVREFCAGGASLSVPLLEELSPASGSLDTRSFLRSGIREVMAEVCRAVDATWLVSEQEAEPVISSLARATNAIGVFAESSDYAMFQGVRYLPLSLNEGLLSRSDGAWEVAMDTPWQGVTAEAVARGLGVDSDHLAVVAALTGNDFTGPVLETTGAHAAMGLQGTPVGPAHVAACLHEAAEALSDPDSPTPTVAGVPVPQSVADAVNRWPELMHSVDAAVDFYSPSSDLGPDVLRAHRARVAAKRGGGPHPALSLPSQRPDPEDPTSAAAWRRGVLQALRASGAAPCDTSLLHGIKWEHSPLDTALDGPRLHQLPLLMHVHGCPLLLRRVGASPEAVLRAARRTRCRRMGVSAGDAIAVLEAMRETQAIVPAWSHVRPHDVMTAVAAAAGADAATADDGDDGRSEAATGGSSHSLKSCNVPIPSPVGGGEQWPDAGVDPWTRLLAADHTTRACAVSCLAHLRALANTSCAGPTACLARAKAVVAWHRDALARLPASQRRLVLAACALCSQQHHASIIALPRDALKGGNSAPVVKEGDVAVSDAQRERILEKARGRTEDAPTPTLALAEHELIAIVAAACAARACDPQGAAATLGCGTDSTRCYLAAAGRICALTLPVDFRPRLRSLVLAEGWRHQVGATGDLAALLAVPDCDLPPSSAAWQLATTVLHWLLDAVARARARYPNMPAHGDRACCLAATQYLLGDALCNSALLPILNAVTTSVRYLRAEGLAAGFAAPSLEQARAPLPDWKALAAAAYPAHAVAGMEAHDVAEYDASTRGKSSVRDLAEEVVEATAAALEEAEQASAAYTDGQAQAQGGSGQGGDAEEAAEGEAVAPTLDGADPEREWATQEPVEPTPLPDGEDGDEEDTAAAPPAEERGGESRGLLPPLPADAARLPIAAHMDNLLASIDSHTVTCVQGETGCGKTTAVPLALLLRHRAACARAVARGAYRTPYEAARVHPLHVVVTQPRRIAARTVAQRVASLLGEPVGRSVGYRVSMEGEGRLFGCPVMFVTTGYLLQVLTHQREALGKLTHLVLDEVHERGVDADLLAMLVRTRMRVALRHRAKAAAGAAAAASASDAGSAGAAATTASEGDAASTTATSTTTEVPEAPGTTTVTADPATTAATTAFPAPPTTTASPAPAPATPATTDTDSGPAALARAVARYGGHVPRVVIMSATLQADKFARYMRPVTVAVHGRYCPDTGLRTERLYLPSSREQAAQQGMRSSVPGQQATGPLAPLLALQPLHGRDFGSTLARAAGLGEETGGTTTVKVAIPSPDERGASILLAVTVHEAFRLVPWPTVLAWARIMCPTFNTACTQLQHSRDEEAAATALAAALSDEAVQQLLRSTAAPHGHVAAVPVDGSAGQSRPPKALLPGALELFVGEGRVQLRVRLSPAALRDAARRHSVALFLPPPGRGEDEETSQPLVTVTRAGRCSVVDLQVEGARAVAALLSLPFHTMPSKPQPVLPADGRSALAASLWQWARREALAFNPASDAVAEAVLAFLRGAALHGPSRAACRAFAPTTGAPGFEVELLPAFCALDWPAIVAGAACTSTVVHNTLDELAARREAAPEEGAGDDKPLQSLCMLMSRGMAARVARRQGTEPWPLPGRSPSTPTSALSRPVAFSVSVEPALGAFGAAGDHEGNSATSGTPSTSRRWQWVLRASVDPRWLLRSLPEDQREWVAASCASMCIPNRRVAVPLVRASLPGHRGDDADDALLNEVGPFVAASLLAPGEEPAAPTGSGTAAPQATPQSGSAQPATPSPSLVTVPTPQLQVGAHRYPVQTLFLEEVLPMFPAAMGGLTPREMRDVQACCQASFAALDRARRVCGVAAGGPGDHEGWEEVVKAERPLVRTKGIGMPRNVVPSLVASTIVALLRERDDPCILAFVPGMLDIMDVCSKLERALSYDEASFVDIIPLHSMVPKEEKDAAFAPAAEGRWKVVVATNIAESSITIPDAAVVVDAGLQKELVFDQRKGLMRLDVVSASQASAAQREGRVGRVGPGLCLRLFTRAHYLLEAERFDLPEIGRIPLDQVVLRLRRTPQLGPVRFALSLLPDPPLDATLQSACDALHRTGALAAPRDDASVTTFGRFASTTPCSVPMARVVYAALFLGCGAQACVAVAAMSLQDVWAIPYPRFAPSPEAFASQALRVAQSRAAHDGGHLSDPAALISLFLAWVSSAQSSYDAVSLGVSHTRTRQWAGLASLLAHSALTSVSEEVKEEAAKAARGHRPGEQWGGAAGGSDPVEAALVARLGVEGLGSLRALAGLQRRGNAPHESHGPGASLPSPAACCRELQRSFTHPEAMDRLKVALLVGAGSESFAVGVAASSTQGLGPVWDGAPMPHALLEPVLVAKVREHMAALIRHTFHGVAVARKPELLPRPVMGVVELLADVLACANTFDDADDAMGGDDMPVYTDDYDDDMSGYGDYHDYMAGDYMSDDDGMSDYEDDSYYEDEVLEREARFRGRRKERAEAARTTAVTDAEDALRQIQAETGADFCVDLPSGDAEGGGEAMRRIAVVAADAVARVPDFAPHLRPCQGQLGTLSLLKLAKAVLVGTLGKNKTTATVLCAPQYHPGHVVARTLLPLPPKGRDGEKPSPPSLLWQQVFQGERTGTPVPRTPPHAPTDGAGFAPSVGELAAAWNVVRGAFPSALLPAPPQLHAAARMMRNPPDMGMSVPEDPVPPGAPRLAPPGDLVKLGKPFLSSALKLSVRVRNDAEGETREDAARELFDAGDSDGEAEWEGEDEAGRRKESALDAAIDLVDLAAAREGEDHGAGGAQPLPKYRPGDHAIAPALLDQRSFTSSALTASEALTPVLVVPGTMSLQGKKNVQLGCPTLFDLSQPPSAAALLLSWNEISTSLTLLVGDVANGGTDSDGAVPDALTHGTLTLTAVKVNGVTAKLVRPARIDIDVVNAFRQAMGPSQPQAAAWDSARRVLVEAGESVQVPPRTYWARVMSCPPPEGGEPRLLQRLGLVLLPS